MKFNKAEKVIICIVIFLCIIAIKNTYPQIKSYIKTQKQDQLYAPEYLETKNLPKDIKDISKKLAAFEDIYLGEEKIFIYGYDPLSTTKSMGQKFHEDLSSKIEQQKDNIHIKIIPYKDCTKILEKVQMNNNRDIQACTMFSPEEKDLETIITLTEECFYNSCIIDSKNKKYTKISRNPDFITAQLIQTSKTK